ncbi:MAG TPA: ABC transporter ATP-binding protein, partial [Ramlibacter sp.]|nr:ABC transporter ATP-binding protein [Ramlibacter sp.]
EALQAWYGDSHVLHGVNLEVREGETVTLIGRNGAGKTTTMRSLVGLVRRRKGRMSLRGRDLMSLAMHEVSAAGLAYVPEERGIFSRLSVEENLLLPRRVADGGLSLPEVYAMFPQLHERRQSPGTKLSGGEQQMLAIARVLRSGARLLLLDEPTEGLAPVIVQQIGRLLQELKGRGYSILMVEQNFRFASRVADRFYVMEDGRTVDTFANSELPARMESLHERLGV